MYMSTFHIALLRAGVVCLLFVLLAGGVALPNVQANEAGAEKICPIQSRPQATLLGPSGRIEANDVFVSGVEVLNDSDYFLSGVSVGVVAYDENEVPQYWMVLPTTYQLPPRTTIPLPVELDLQVLRAGTYTLQAYAVQGGPVAVLGKAFAELPSEAAVRVVKTENPIYRYPISLYIDDQLIERSVTDIAVQTATIKAVVENQNEIPLLDSQWLLVAAEGGVPVGAAVRADKISPVALIPKASQSGFLRNTVFGSGRHTVYAALLSQNVLQPIKTVSLRFPGEDQSLWSYISAVGVSDYPVTTDTTVAACVATVNGGVSQGRFAESLGISFALKKGGSTVVEETIYTADVDTHDFVTFTPSVNALNFDLEVSLLQQRFNTPYIESDTYTWADFQRDSLTPVQFLRQSFVCSDEACGQGGGRIVTDLYTETAKQKPFWFYMGVILAATLLLYIMLRRLPTKRTPVVNTKLHNLSDDELQ